jgi:hypothetical protein
MLGTLLAAGRANIVPGGFSMTSRGFQLGRALLAGSVAGLASAGVVAWRSRRETGSAWAGLNAISHWLFGPRAYRVDQASAGHTVAGLAVHQASALFWGALYEALIANLRGDAGADGVFVAARPPTTADATAAAAIVTALAAYTDLRVVPPRLSPGFEHRISPGSVALTYLAFAGGLALTGIAMTKAR